MIMYESVWASEWVCVKTGEVWRMKWGGTRKRHAIVSVPHWATWAKKCNVYERRRHASCLKNCVKPTECDDERRAFVYLSLTIDMLTRMLQSVKHDNCLSRGLTILGLGRRGLGGGGSFSSSQIQFSLCHDDAQIQDGKPTPHEFSEGPFSFLDRACVCLWETQLSFIASQNQSHTNRTRIQAKFHAYIKYVYKV